MKTIEFETRVEGSYGLRVPPEVAAQIPKGQTVKVLVVIPEQPSEDEEEREWVRMAQERFVAGYADGDSIYDAL